MDTTIYKEFEATLRRRMYGVRLILEIGLDSDTVSRSREHLEALSQRLRDPEVALGKHLPATLATYLVGLGVDKYDGGLWPHQQIRWLDSSKLGPAFAAALRRLDLETFEYLEDDLAARRYLTPILAHGGVPRFSTGDFLGLVVEEQRRHPGVRADDLVALWRTRRTAFAGIDAPVRRFLLHGGDVAADFLDRTIDLIAIPPDRAIAEASGLGLPAHVVETWAGWKKGAAVKTAAAASRLPHPAIRFDPWSGIGPVAELPPVGLRHREATWRVISHQDARQFRASLTDQQAVQLRPAPAWEVEFDDSAGGKRTFAYEVLRDSPVICFDPATGTYVPDTRPIALSSAWLLMPAGTELMVQRDSGEWQAPRVVAELPEPAGGWAGFTALHVDLDLVRVMRLKRGSAQDAAATSFVRVASPGDRPGLVGAPVADVVGEEGERVFAEPPALRIPAVPGFDTERWQIKVVTGSYAFSGAASDLERTGDDYVIPLPKQEFVGLVEVGVRGPLGSDLRERFTLVPALVIKAPAQLLMPDLHKAFVEVTAAPDVLIDGSPADTTVRLEVPPIGTDLPISVQLGGEARLRIQLPRLQWGTVSQGASSVAESLLHIDRDELEAGQVEAIIVVTRRPGTPLWLELWGDQPIQSTPTVVASQGAGRWAFPLGPFRDTVRASALSALRFRLHAGSQSAVIATIDGAVGATDFRVEEISPRKARVLFEQTRNLRDRVARLWSLDRPWAGPLSIDLAEGETSFEVALDDAPPGRYRIEVAVDDPWVRPRRPDLHSPGIADVVLGGDEALRQRLNDLRSGSEEDRLEFAVLTKIQPPEFAAGVSDDVAGWAFSGLLARLRDEGDEPSRTSRLLAHIASSRASLFVSRLADDVAREALLPEAALRAFLVARAAGWSPSDCQVGPSELRILWSACPPLAAALDLPSAIEGNADARDRCEQFLGWRPGENLPENRGLAQNELGLSADQLRWARATLGLIPKEILSSDTWAVAMFDWLIAEKERGLISSEWWGRYGWLADSVPVGAEDAAGLLSARRAPEKHPDRWAAFPQAVLAASLNLALGNGETFVSAVALINAIRIGALGLVVHDLCAVGALMPMRQITADEAHEGNPTRPSTLGALEVGQSVRGRIARRTDDGYFVEVGGPADAYMYQSEVTPDPSGARPELRPGVLVDAVVQSIEESSGRCRISMRALEARPRLSGLSVGDKVRGTVVASIGSAFMVDLGYIGALLSVSRASEAPVLGSEVEMFVASIDPERGLVRLSDQDLAASRQFLGGLAVGSRVPCVVTEVAELGLFVSVGPAQGLIHSSRLPGFRARLPDTYHVGQELDAEIIEVDLDRCRASLSRTFLQDEAFERVRERLVLGQPFELTVEETLPFGLIVADGDVRGLIHETELSWLRDVEPEDFPVGTRLKAKLIGIDPERSRLTFSLREMTSDPRLNVIGGLSVGQALVGIVTRVVNFGAFVRINGQLDALVHVLELPEALDPNLAPAEAIAKQAPEGASVHVRVLSIDSERRRVGLTMRTPHPWLDDEGLPSAGALIRGTIFKISEDGVLTHLEGRLIGLLSPEASEVRDVSEGDEITAVVVGIDAERRLVLLEGAANTQ